MKQRLITIVLTALILVVPMAIMPSAEENYNLPKIIALLLLGVVLLILLLLNYKKINIDKKDILIFIFAVLILISTIFSSQIKTSIFGMKRRYEGMLSLYVYILIYLCAKKFLYYKNKKTLIVILYCLYIPICILAMLQYYLKVPELYPIFNKGVCGTFGNTNFMGSFLTLGMPIFSLLFISKGYKISFVTSNLAFFALVTCLARSAWVAFIVLIFIILIYLIKRKDKKLLLRTIALVTCFALIFGFLFIPQKVNSKGKPIKTRIDRKVSALNKEIKTITTKGINERTGSDRIQIWGIALELILKHPIVGVGTDNLAYSILKNPSSEAIDYMQRTNQLIDKAHNEYFQIAATLGIPALIVYLTFVCLILTDKQKQLFNNLGLLITCTSIVCYLIQAFFNISTIGVAPLFWFALGLTDNKMILNKEEKDIKENK